MRPLLLFLILFSTLVSCKNRDINTTTKGIGTNLSDTTPNSTVYYYQKVGDYLHRGLCNEGVYPTAENCTTGWEKSKINFADFKKTLKKNIENELKKAREQSASLKKTLASMKEELGADYIAQSSLRQELTNSRYSYTVSVPYSEEMESEAKNLSQGSDQDKKDARRQYIFMEGQMKFYEQAIPRLEKELAVFERVFKALGKPYPHQVGPDLGPEDRSHLSLGQGTLIYQVGSSQEYLDFYPVVSRFYRAFDKSPTYTDSFEKGLSLQLQLRFSQLILTKKSGNGPLSFDKSGILVLEDGKVNPIEFKDSEQRGNFLNSNPSILLDEKLFGFSSLNSSNDIKEGDKIIVHKFYMSSELTTDYGIQAEHYRGKNIINKFFYWFPAANNPIDEPTFRKILGDEFDFEFKNTPFNTYTVNVPV